MYSCSNGEKKYEKQLAILDSLSKELDKADSLLNSIDTLKLTIAHKEMLEQMEYLQQNYKDTMETALALFINEYHYVKKPFAVFLTESKKLAKELSYSRGQVKDLSDDLKHDRIEEKKVGEYFAAEVTEISKITGSVNIAVQVVKEYFPKFDEMDPRMKQVVNELKQKQQNEKTK